MSAYPRILPVGEAAFTVEFGNRVDARLTARVHALDALLTPDTLPGFIETVPTYRALLVRYDPCVCPADEVEAALGAHLDAWAEIEPPEGRLIEIPVRYGGDAGPDLASVAQHAGLSPAEVIRLHTAPTYRVAMLGFAPGFAYLQGLDPRIAAPRLETPRTCVPSGSVGIAGGQTGVYALDTPGGWRILGRTDLALFDPAREAPFLLQAGDRVRFIAEDG
ncbi:MAG: 5-oxoprolinase subunit PxpB [Anaerolineae bacterium]